MGVHASIWKKNKPDPGPAELIWNWLGKTTQGLFFGNYSRGTIQEWKFKSENYPEILVFNLFLSHTV